jgi:hypothetical protein
MCLSPDQMTSGELENLIAHYREVYGVHSEFGNRIIAELEQLLKERAENGTYHLVPTTTPRHLR